MADTILSKPQESTFPSGWTTTMTNETEEDDGWTLGDGGNEAIREEREKEDFIYHIPESQKSVQPQSGEKQGLWSTVNEESVISCVTGKNRLKLCSVFISFYFVSPSDLFKEKRIYTCRRVAVACKDMREWGWRRYGCVGSSWMLCAFGGVTCAVHCEVDAQKRFAFI